MATISGILTDGAGQIINDCTIELYAKKTTTNVLMQTQAFTVTSDGKYSMNVLPCEYDVSLIINGFPKKRLGSINVYSDSRNGTLNDFLINPKESELTPEFIKQVMDARDDAKKSENNAKKWASTIDTSTLVKKSGDTMTGQLILSEFGIKHRYTDSENMMVSRTRGDNYAHIFYDAEKKQWQDKLIYNSTANAWRFQYVNDVVINGKSVLKTGDYGIGSLTGAKLDNPDETLKGGCYATRTTEFTELTEYQNRNDSASLVVYPAWTEKWYVEKLAVVQSKTPRIYYRCATPNGKQPFYESITTANINNYLPVGVPLPWPTNQPPAGWLECNGSTFDKNKFPKLAVVYPTGKLPDLRGVFIRGKDNLRGLDPYRDILSYQDDAIRNIKGGLPTGNFKALLGHSKIEAGDKNGAILTQSAGDDYIASSASSTNPRQLRWMFFDFDASRVVPTANENRPRNVAFNYIVKAE
ncbi:prophage tail fiber N-terminal domain-containing protein [uncultured Gilliamella sp.]|uniref:prophage tail fiber N-terminal domain-containing protein n=1 Tax=uncultured Gilliamella sp. TaxID=1193505 RepID=UPI0025DFA120|nr:prophage tail fiber N-terminal domain-containing protein [uncultured Gilliamella sp.]